MISVFDQRPFQRNPIVPTWLSCDAAQEAKRFHETFSEYSTTPLHSLSNLAKEIWLGEIYVKDESFRFGLNAFKALGASFAIGQLLARQFHVPISELHTALASSPELRKRCKEMTFVTATDGNHGYGVAWTSARFGAKSVVYMPQGSSLARLQRIRDMGAKAEIVPMNYDDAVRLAADHAEKQGWEVVQDTAWTHYEQVPRDIMQGYLTLSYEAWLQMNQQLPSHIFIQAGVGSLAASVIGFFSSFSQDKRPICIVVEPQTAACCYESVVANDGHTRVVGGELKTIMAGLACGEVNPLAWPILQNRGDFFVTIPDDFAAEAMARLAYPSKEDPRIISGESGAAGFALLWQLCKNPEYQDLKHQFQLGPESRVLCINSEGDIDPESYLREIHRYKGRFVL